MGNPRKPAAVRKREGNRGKRPIPPEPGYGGKVPAPPAFVKGSGLKEWKRLAPIMSAEGVLTEADWAVFTLYCDAVTRRWEIRTAQAKEKKSSAEWHLLDRALDRAEKQLAKAITELGLSPVTRSKAAREKPEQKDEFEDFDGTLKVVEGGKK